MDALKHFNLQRRDSLDSDDSESPFAISMGHLIFVLFSLLLVASLCAIALFYLRRKRLAGKQAQLLPTTRPYSHHRSRSIMNFNSGHKNESIFVYDEKMNLIHNSSSPPSAAIPEIRITFPDEEGNSDNVHKGRVVVVHVTDSGSVGMEPVDQENLPPYQKEDAGRFQSLDLERIGGLKEKDSSTYR